MKKLYTLLAIVGVSFVLAMSCVKQKTPEELEQERNEQVSQRYEYKNLIKNLKPGMTSYQVDSSMNRRPYYIYCHSYFDGENCRWIYGNIDRPDFVLHFSNDTLVSKMWKERP